MHPSVSVIIPVFNVERYIGKCARSLFSQTLENMEFIFVNDGTPDDSMQVLRSVMEEYPEREASVKIVDKPRNEGLPAARRTGVEIASGDYVIHCDSDDWVEPDMYAKLYSKALEGDYDMVLCRLDEIDEKGNPVHVDRDDYETGDVLGALVGMEIHHYVLNKLVRRARYEGVVFPEYNMWEDVPTIIQLAAKCKSFGFVDEALYHYVRHSESIASQAPSAQKMDQMRANLDMAAEYLEKENLYEKYLPQLRHTRRMVKVDAQRLPRTYYKTLYSGENLSLLFDRKITVAEKLGHITSLLGIHGLSDKFKKK